MARDNRLGPGIGGGADRPGRGPGRCEPYPQCRRGQRRCTKGPKAVILDELCAATGWHHDHGRRALRGALGPRGVAGLADPHRPSRSILTCTMLFFRSSTSTGGCRSFA